MAPFGGHGGGLCAASGHGCRTDGVAHWLSDGVGAMLIGGDRRSGVLYLLRVPERTQEYGRVHGLSCVQALTTLVALVSAVAMVVRAALDFWSSCCFASVFACSCAFFARIW